MNVRDLQCWPPRWQGARGAAERPSDGVGGTLIAVHWDVKTRAGPQSVTLTMEADGDRYSGVLEDEPTSLAELYLLLRPLIGRPLAKIESLAMTRRH